MQTQPFASIFPSLVQEGSLWKPPEYKHIHEIPDPILHQGVAWKHYSKEKQRIWKPKFYVLTKHSLFYTDVVIVHEERRGHRIARRNGTQLGSSDQEIY